MALDFDMQLKPWGARGCQKFFPLLFPLFIKIRTVRTGESEARWGKKREMEGKNSDFFVMKIFFFCRFSNQVYEERFALN